MASASVAIRPFRPSDFDEVRRGYRLPGAFGEFPQGNLDASDEKIRRMVSGDEDSAVSRFAIVALDQVVGEVQCWSGRGAFLPDDVFGLGVVIWDATNRGRGFGREAQRQLVDRLFHDMGARRVQAGTNPENVAERRCLEHLGFVQEGVLRRFFPAPDGDGDIVMYALLREEWERRP